MAVVMISSGMAYMLLWNPLVHHVQLWATGGDLWGMYRGAQYVSWGSIGDIYTPSDGILTFPGMPILLTPCAILAAKFHLSATFGIVLARPSAALVLQPVELALSSTAVFAADALAERVSVTSERRIALCAAVAVIAWPTAAVWGHAEDALAVALALYALRAALNGRWPSCGWLLGFGILVQPLVALLIPMMLGATPAGRRLALAARSLVLSVVLVGIAFVGDRGDTYRALIKQPTPPAINHATPWVALAPRIPSQSHGPFAPASTRIEGQVYWNAPHIRGANIQVAAGPGRMIYLVLAVLLGVYVWRRPQDATRLVWLAAVVLGLRCLFEAVMTPYYLAPPLIVAFVAVALQGRRRFWTSVVIGMAMTIWSYFHLSPWVWWLPIVVGTATILVLGFPNGGVPLLDGLPQSEFVPSYFDVENEGRPGRAPSQPPKALEPSA